LQSYYYGAPEGAGALTAHAMVRGLIGIHSQDAREDDSMFVKRYRSNWPTPHPSLIKAILL
jgi:hypothetical protein